MKTPVLVTLLASVCLTGVASAAWLRIPTAEPKPVNLANPIILGTQVQSSTGITNPAALIANSSAAAANLAAGKSEAVISMGEQQLIDQVSFLNDGAAAQLVISTSADLKEWTSAAEQSFGVIDRQVQVKFAGTQAKYVRLSFDTATASSIRFLKLGGKATTQDYKAVPVDEAKAIEVNLASTALGARPIYMFPTPTNFDADDAQQTFKFPRTKELFRTVVYDLGSVRTIKKFNAAYSRIPVKVQAYVFEQLPEKKDWRGKMTLDPVVFDELKPVAMAEDAKGEGSVQLVPERPVQAQYVALRFEPNYSKGAVSGMVPNWREMAFAVVFPFAGVAREFGLIDKGRFAQAADEGADDFIVYDAAAGGTLSLAVVSKSTISAVMQQLGPGADEAQAVNSILSAAGLTPSSKTGVGDIDGGQKPKPAADPSAPNPRGEAGLNALGLSAYRGSGGGASGPSPFTATPGDPSTTAGTAPLPSLAPGGGVGTARPTATGTEDPGIVEPPIVPGGGVPLTVAPTSP